MKLFKNFKTKKQLREEIKQLEFKLLTKPTIGEFPTTQKLIEELRSSTIREQRFLDVPEEVFKNQIANNLVEQIKPFIRYNVKKAEDGAQIFTGIICVVEEGDKNEINK